MKRIIAISVWIVCLSICHEAIAENKTDAKDVVYLVSNPQTARWSYIETDSNGKLLTSMILKQIY